MAEPTRIYRCPRCRTAAYGPGDCFCRSHGVPMVPSEQEVEPEARRIAALTPEEPRTIESIRIERDEVVADLLAALRGITAYVAPPDPEMAALHAAYSAVERAIKRAEVQP